MELDCYVQGTDVATIGAAAAELESHGHGCLWSNEAQHDPFLPLAIAAGRPDDDHAAGHPHRGGFRPEPHDAGLYRARPATAVR